MLATARLHLRPLGADDTGFLLRLVNDPDWLRYIGDRHIHDTAAALAYIERCHAMHRQHGVSLLAVTRRGTADPIGLCGLLRREHWEEMDLGYAFLPAFRGQGYAREAAAALLEHGHRALQRPRIVAVTHPENTASAALLCGLGFIFERELPGSDGVVQSHLFAHELP